MVLRVVGKVFVGTGVLILLFVGYELFGTNLVTSRHQEALASELRAEWRSKAAPGEQPAIRELPPPPVSPEPTPHPSPDSGPPRKLDPGRGMAIIHIPRIGLEQVVVEGVSVADLKKGPGHVPGTASPGQAGNVAISGHRTTYGAPFKRLDELEAGDEISLTTARGRFLYVVTHSKVVAPSEVSVLDPTPDARLTLTTCHPKFSARQRLIVIAHLVRMEKAA
jgi:sortase A